MKPGYQSATTYHDQNLLKTVCVAMGLSTCPGAAQDAAPMADFFTTGSPGGSSNSVIISSPGNGATVDETVHFVAHASESVSVSQVQVWDNGIKLGWFSGTGVDQSFALAPGSHTTTVLDLDSNYNVIHLSTVSFSVR